MVKAFSVGAGTRNLSFLEATLDVFNVAIVEDFASLHDCYSCAEIFGFIKSMGGEQD